MHASSPKVMVRQALRAYPLIPILELWDAIMNQRSEPAVPGNGRDNLAQAIADDKSVVDAFNDRIVQLAKDFGERETATICRVSVDYVYKLRDKRGIVFADPKKRTRPEQNEISRRFKVERAATFVRSYEQRKPVQPGELKILPGLELASRRAMIARENAFYTKVLEHAQTMTFQETAKLLGVTPRFLRNYCYAHEIEFEGYTFSSTAGLDLYDIPFDAEMSGAIEPEDEDEAWNVIVNQAAEQLELSML